jgi:CheY-like chemotaxis protein
MTPWSRDRDLTIVFDSGAFVTRARYCRCTPVRGAALGSREPHSFQELRRRDLFDTTTGTPHAPRFHVAGPRQSTHDCGFVLAVQPDPFQATILECALANRTSAELTVAASADAALGIVDRRIPDLILLDAFMRPPDEDYLLAYMRALPGAAHVQVLSLPHLQPTPPPDLSPPRRSLFARRIKPQGNAFAALGFDASQFATDAAAYLRRAVDIRRHAQNRIDDYPDPTDRRGSRRWAPPEVPWLMSVQLTTGERADLINISSDGALVRTDVRPQLLAPKHSDLDFVPQPGLTLQLTSGAQVRAHGRVIRCQVKSDSMNLVYDVAFRFDASLGLTLPVPHELRIVSDRI